MTRVVAALISILLISSCSKGDTRARPGPVLTQQNLPVCDTLSSHDRAFIEILPPGNRPPSDDARPAGPETTLVDDVRENQVGVSVESAVGTVALYIPSDIEAQESFPLEIVDAKTCDPVMRLDATLLRRTELHTVYQAPHPAPGALTPGQYMVRTGPSGLMGEVIGVDFFARPERASNQSQCDGELVEEDVFDTGTRGGEKEYTINSNEPVHVCVEMEQQSKFWLIREVTINEQRVHPKAESSEDSSSYLIEYPSRSHSHVVKVNLAKGRAGIKIRTRKARRGQVRPAINCAGHLESFDTPFTDVERRRIHRGQVLVTCSAVFRSKTEWTTTALPQKTYTSKPIIKRVTTLAFTDDQGRFEASISPGAFLLNGVTQADELLGVESDCLFNSQCGVEREGSHVTEPEGLLWLPIRNVPDIVSNGLTARLLSTGRSPTGGVNDGLLARTFYRASSVFGSNTINDLPVVVHEAFDPLLEDGTGGLVWALGGQPTDYSKPFRPNTIRPDHRNQPIRGACYSKFNQLFPDEPVDPACTWTPACQSSLETQTARFRCEGSNILKTMLDEGYDVWLIDHIAKDPSILELANRSPILYQRISDYPDIPFRPKPDRKMSIVGLSMGGVVARVSVRMWELKDKLNRVDDEPLLQLYRSEQLRNTADERVALYISFEAPHNGSKVPVGFQALIKDSTFPSRGNFYELLASRSAAELTVPYVLDQVETNCILGGLPNDCLIGPNTINPALQSLTESTFFKFYSEDLLDALDSLPPRPSILPGAPRLDWDGIPKRVPSVAVSNGRLDSDAFQVAGRLADIKLKKRVLGIDPLVPDDHIKLDDSADLHGSGLEQIYRLKELEESGREYLIFTGELTADVKRRPTFVSTGSALSLDNFSALLGPREVALRWDDALTQSENRSHFNFDDRQCAFLMYHLDGKMKGDRDGYPSCSEAASTCSAGRRIPGLVVAPDGFFTEGLEHFCDPDDNNENVLPPAIQKPIVKWHAQGEVNYPVLELD